MTHELYGASQLLKYRQAQRRYNLWMSEMAENAALGIKKFSAVESPEKIPHSHFIDAASKDIARGVDIRSAHSSLQMLMTNFVSEDK